MNGRKKREQRKKRTNSLVAKRHPDILTVPPIKLPKALPDSGDPNQYLNPALQSFAEKNYYVTPQNNVDPLHQIENDYAQRNYTLGGYRHLGYESYEHFLKAKKEKTVADIIKAQWKSIFPDSTKDDLSDLFINSHSQLPSSLINIVRYTRLLDKSLKPTLGNTPEEMIINAYVDNDRLFLECYYNFIPIQYDQNSIIGVLDAPFYAKFEAKKNGDTTGWKLLEVRAEDELILKAFRNEQISTPDLLKRCKPTPFQRFHAFLLTTPYAGIGLAIGLLLSPFTSGISIFVGALVGALVGITMAWLAGCFSPCRYASPPIPSSKNATYKADPHELPDDCSFDPARIPRGLNQSSTSSQTSSAQQVEEINVPEGKEAVTRNNDLFGLHTDTPSISSNNLSCSN